jgi:Putative DNA-binding domain
MPELAELQGWLQARVTAGVWDLPEDPAAGLLAADVVVGGGPLAPLARLAIYAKSYGLRLAECLRAELPVLAAMVGPEVFNLFAGAYLGARPSRSRSLYDLGAGFADYLAATRPPGAAGALAALPADLARLERAIAESGRAAGLESEPPSAPLDTTTLLVQPAARLVTPGTLRLLRLGFDFTEALAAHRAGARPLPPPARETFVAVARRRYAVRVHLLEPWAFAWLEALAANGGDVQAAVRAAAEGSDRAPGEVLGSLLLWLPGAAEAGFVSHPPALPSGDPGFF